MQITCTHCGQQLMLADDKVPSRPFALVCPHCKGRVRITPPVAQQPQAPPPVQEPPPAVRDTGSFEAQSGGAGAAPKPGTFEPLPSLQPQEVSLLSTLCPIGFVVEPEGVLSYQLAAGLRLLGLNEVEQFTDLEIALSAAEETEVGIILFHIGQAPPPPSAPLAPLYKLSSTVRRRTFVALIADNVHTLDGQVAFLLQVNCLINTNDLARMPGLLRRALIHHLKLYRFWDDDAA